MSSLRYFFIVALTGILIFLLNSGTSKYFSKPELPRYSKVAEFMLTDQNRNNFGTDLMLGNTVILQVFFASCPHICPMVTKKVANLKANLSAVEDLMFVSITIDPENDNPAVLKNYAAKFNADSEDWKFLTGDKSVIEKLLKESLYLDAGPDKNMHSTRLVLIDKDLVIRGYYSSNDEESLKRLLVDAKSL